MRPIRTIAALATLALAACSSAGGTDPSTPPLTTPTTSVSIAPPTTSTPASSGSFSGPPRPTTPTIPADVPRTGANTRPGEKPPLMPLEATQHTARGAQAFAAFFVKTIDWGYATVSGAYMRHYFATTCMSCRRPVSS